jgi:hypothetical protein
VSLLPRRASGNHTSLGGEPIPDDANVRARLRKFFDNAAAASVAVHSFAMYYTRFS